MKLYHGQIDLTFKERGHKYFVNSVEVPNVTKILGVLDKPALVGWAAKETAGYWENLVKPGQPLTLDEVEIAEHVKASKMARFKTSGKALQVGTLVHEYAEAVAKGTPCAVPTNEQAAAGCEAFNKWWMDNHIEVIAAERRLMSREHWYVGTCDLYARINGELAVVDYKTSSGIYDEMKAQVGGAYRVAIEEETGEPITAAYVVRFGKDDGKFEVHRIRDFDACWRLFKAALDVYVAQQQIKAA